MSMSKNKRIVPSTLKMHLPLLIFLFAAAFSIVTTWYITSHILDSDASSEMVLAHQLSETGKIMSMDWLYSTELRVLNSQLLFAFFFHIWNDWHLVRFSSAILLQALMVYTYSFMLRKAGFPKNSILIGAAMLLLPASVTYGRIVLYHSHYIVHLCLAFFIVGMIIKIAAEFSFKKVATYLQLALLMGLSFVGGLAGVRHLMVIFAPLILSIILFCFVEDFKSPSAQDATLLSVQKLRFLLPGILMVAASLAGVVVNSTILQTYFSFSQYTDTTLEMLNFSQLAEVLYGFFHQFGYRKNLSLLSLMGILSLLALVAGSYCLVSSVKRVFRYSREDHLGQAMINAFFLCFTVVMLTLFLLTGGYGKYYYVLYLSPCYPWAITLVISDWPACKEKIHPLNVKRIFYWLTVACFLLNSLANIGFFWGVKAFDQPYEGLGYNNRDCVAQKQAAVDFLCDKGYSIGYATYWNCNVVTEISDGKLQMINLSLDSETGNLSYNDWLTSLYLREVPNENPFILITQQEKDSFEKSDIFSSCIMIYEDTYHCIYHIERLDKTLFYW